MPATKINGTKITQLDARAGPDEVVTEDDAKQPAKLARMLGTLLTSMASLSRAWAPQRIDFEDVVVSTGGAQVTLAHGFNGRVRWWIVGWVSTGTTAPILRESSATATDANTLRLQSYVAGTACIRVEASG